MKDSILEIPRVDELDGLSNASEIMKMLDAKGVLRAIDCNNWQAQYPYKPRAGFMAAYSAKNLYIDFLVRCNFLRAVNTADNSPVSEDSCVEVFLQPEPDGEYFNFEFNCIGTIYGSHRMGRPNPTRFNSEQLALVKRYPSCGTRPFCEVEGNFMWNLLVVIPYSLMGIDEMKSGTRMRGNFYKCASASSSPHFLSWAPIESPQPDFHRPEYFGTIIFK